jgi:VCBS repeat-containing protein
MSITYTSTSFDLGNFTAAYDINELGQITGYFSASGKFHAFVYRLGDVAPIIRDWPFFNNGTEGYGINDAGQIVGDYANGFTNQGFFFESAVAAPVTLQGRFGWDINNAGQIVGDDLPFVVDSTPSGFFFNSDGSRGLPILYPEASGTSAQGINDNGEVVGYYRDSNGFHGFTYVAGSYTSLADIAPGQTFATGINDSGWIVGYYLGVGDIAHGFVDVNGAALGGIQEIGQDLNAAGVFPQGINDQGQIVGYYLDNSGGTHAFVASVTITNNAPIAVADNAVVQKGTPVTANVLANDSDTDHDALHVAKVNGLELNVGQPIHGANGTLTLDEDGSYSYTPDSNVKKSSQDVFTYTIGDGQGGTASSTLTFIIEKTTPFVGGTTISDGFRHPLGSGFLTEDASTTYLGHDEGFYTTKKGAGHGYSVALNFNEFNSDINKGKGSYHLGEDWNGSGGGDTDLGAPVFAISNGQVISAIKNSAGLGSYVVVQHDLPSPLLINGEWRTSVFSLYSHLDSIDVLSGQTVAFGEQVGTIGKSGEGVKSAHLHFEIRLTDPRLGAEFQDFDGYNPTGAPSNWVDPTDFINAFREIPESGSGSTSDFWFI